VAGVEVCAVALPQREQKLASAGSTCPQYWQYFVGPAIAAVIVVAGLAAERSAMVFERRTR